MRVSLCLVVATASAVNSLSIPSNDRTNEIEERNKLPYVSSKALIAKISTNELFKKAKILEDIAYATPDRNRAIGTLGHNHTVDYLEAYFSTPKMSAYYDFYKQGFPLPKADKSILLLNDISMEAFAMVDAPSGKLTAPLVLVPNLACNTVCVQS